MNEILPVPVAEARKYLGDKGFEKYKEAYDSFYSCQPDYSLVDIALRFFLPKDCEAAKDLAIKRYQIRARDVDVDTNEKIEQMKRTSSPELKSSFMDFIQAAEHTKEVARKQAREYGAEIPV